MVANTAGHTADHAAHTAAPPLTGAALTPTDRCDRCGAQAFVRVELATGDLLFCGHHYARYSRSLRASAIAVHDQTDRLRAQK